MNHFHVAGLRLGAIALSSLSLVMVLPSSGLALRNISSAPSKAVSVTDSVGSTLGIRLMDSDDPVAIAQGGGGDFSYQIWQEAQASQYYLFIWDSTSVPAQAAVRVMGHTVMPAAIEEPVVSYNFASAAEAEDFFTCRYARERLDSCVMVMSAVSDDVPESCAFPWVACKK